MTSRRVLVLVGIVLCAALALGWWALSAGEQVSGTGSDQPTEAAAANRGQAPDPATGGSDAGTGAENGAGEEPAGGRTILGRVENESGRPLAGADVDLYRVRGSWPRWDPERLDSVITAEDGAFVVRDPEPTRGGLQLFVRRAPGRGFLARDYASQWVTVTPAEQPLIVRLGRGYTVTGTVKGADGRPQADVPVFLEPSAWSDRPTIETRTGRRGRFLFRSVAPGLARLSARSERSLPAVQPTVTVGDGKRYELRFSPGEAEPINGIVRRAGTTLPVVGAEVLVYPSTAWNSGLFAPYRAQSDAEGRFSVRGVASGNLRIEIRHPNHSTVSRIVPLGRGVAEQVIELLPRVRVRGRFAGAEGAPLLLICGDGTLGRAEVAADGSFSFQDDDGAESTFSTGPAILEVEDGSRSFALSGSRYYEFEIYEERDSELELSAVDSPVIEGRVVDAQGRPLAGALVSTPRRRIALRSPERITTRSDADGRYAIRGLKIGALDAFFSSVEILFEKDGYAPQSLAVETSGEQRLVEMVRPAAIAGRVTRVGGLPLAGALVFVGQGQGYDATVVTDSDGYYRITGLAPNSEQGYRVKARYSTSPLQVSENRVYPASGETVQDIYFTFAEGTIVRGVVVDERGEQGVNDAAVTALGGDSSSMVAYTDASGRFELEVPDGAEELEIATPDLEVIMRRRLSEHSEAVPIRMPMVPRGSLRLALESVTGRRPSWALIRLSSLDSLSDRDQNVHRQRNWPARWVELSQGILDIADFPEGRSRLRIECVGHRPGTVEVTLSAGEERNLGQLTLEEGAGLTLRVVDSSGRAVVGAVAHVGQEIDFSVPDSRRDFVTDADGRVAVQGISPESRSVVVQADGYARRVLDLELTQLLRDEIEVQLAPAKTLSVQVVGPDGQAMAGGYLELHRDRVLIARARVDETGLVRFTGLGMGRFELSLVGGGVSQLVLIDKDWIGTTVTMQGGR